MINYPAIWSEVESRFAGDIHSIHGPEHWRRVELVGLKIARLLESAGKHADRDVIRLFAVLHDSCRLDDGIDPDHGRRAAIYAEEMRGRLFDIEDARFELLTQAVAWHADGFTVSDLTIGACFDADRMDLRRLGIRPDPAYISIPEMRAKL